MVNSHTAEFSVIQWDVLNSKAELAAWLIIWLGANWI
jgi:hypothetical protein